MCTSLYFPTTNSDRAPEKLKRRKPRDSEFVRFPPKNVSVTSENKTFSTNRYDLYQSTTHRKRKSLTERQERDKNMTYSEKEERARILRNEYLCFSFFRLANFM